MTDLLRDDDKTDKMPQTAPRKRVRKPMTPEYRERERARKAAWHAANREKVLAKKAEHYVANREKVRARAAAYRLANREKIRTMAKAYRMAHPEKSEAYRVANQVKMRAAEAAYRAAHPDRVLASGAKYRAANREKLRENGLVRGRAYRAAHPEKVIASTVKYRAAHPWKLLEIYARRRARRRNASIIERIDRAAIYARDAGKCHLCRKPVDPNRWHLDHLIPLALGGEHAAFNVAVSHPRCNIRKGVKRLPVQVPLLPPSAILRPKLPRTLSP